MDRREAQIVARSAADHRLVKPSDDDTCKRCGAFVEILDPIMWSGVCETCERGDDGQCPECGERIAKDTARRSDYGDLFCVHCVGENFEPA